MPGGSEVFAHDFSADPRCGPDSGHRSQDPVKRVGLRETLDSGEDPGLLPGQVLHLTRQDQHDRRGRACVRDHHGLGRQG